MLQILPYASFTCFFIYDICVSLHIHGTCVYQHSYNTWYCTCCAAFFLITVDADMWDMTFVCLWSVLAPHVVSCAVQGIPELAA